jgi:hypothetical protein
VRRHLEEAAADFPTGYGPSDLQSAYGLTSAASASGSGRTIAIVDAPNAESDLAQHPRQSGSDGPVRSVPRSAPPRAAPTSAGQAPRGKGCDYFHLR